MANETEIALRQDLTTITAGMGGIEITSQETYDRVALFLVKTVQPFRKRWADYWAEPKRLAWEAHKAIVAKFNEGDEKAEQLEKAIKLEIRKWDDEQERIRQERQRAEQRAVEEREARERAAQAAFAEEEGAPPAEIEAIVSAPSIAVAEPVAETYQRVSGISKRDNWKCRVLDIRKLCAAIAKGTVPVNYVLPNEKVLNARARADKGTLNLPGCVPYNDAMITGRSR